jgi:DNA repair photolyase
MVKYLQKEYKSAFNKLKYPDSWFWTRYTINPYSGCAHVCTYCDARSERYYLEQDFENEVIIKQNIAQHFDQQLKKSRTLLIDVVGAGGVCDAYQPIEEEYKNTRKILEVLAKHQFPVNIATKSKLIVRDIDLLKKIAKQTWATVGFSITTTDEKLAHFLEPYSSSPSERYSALQKIKKESPEIQIGIYFIPIIPFLEDDEENLENVIKKSKESGADFVLFSPGLTLRNSQRDFFIHKLKNSQYKDMVNSLLELYGNQTYPPQEYVKRLHPKLLNLCRKYNLAPRVKRWIPPDYRKWNYKISELLLNKEYIDAIETGKSNRTMLWAGLNLNNLSESILDIYNRGEISTIKNFNQNIIKFITPYLEKSMNLNRKEGLDQFL